MVTDAAEKGFWHTFFTKPIWILNLGAIYFAFIILFALIYYTTPEIMCQPTTLIIYNRPDLEPASKVLDFYDYLYFSAIVQTTTGFGDIIPATALGKLFTIIQAIFGHFYFAVVIGMLTGHAVHFLNKEK